MSRRLPALAAVVLVALVGCGPAASTPPAKIAQQQAASFGKPIQATPVVAPAPAPRPVADAPNDVEPITSRVGPADQDTRSPDGSFRALTYQAEQVRITFTHKDGGWALRNFTDLQGRLLTQADGWNRLATRDRLAVKSAAPAAPVVQPPPPPPAKPAVVEELDPGHMFKGDTGTLPTTTAKYKYMSLPTEHGDLLVVVMVWNPGRMEASGRGADAVPVVIPAAWESARIRFLVRPEDVGRPARAEVDNEVLLPGVFAVYGTMTLPGGPTLPRLKKVGP